MTSPDHRVSTVMAATGRTGPSGMSEKCIVTVLAEWLGSGCALGVAIQGFVHISPR